MRGSFNETLLAGVNRREVSGIISLTLPAAKSSSTTAGILPPFTTVRIAIDTNIDIDINSTAFVTRESRTNNHIQSTLSHHILEYSTNPVFPHKQVLDHPLSTQA